ncbi:hypothetical protein F5Y15DRAFT_45620 [Xylariaceae sp. FL0016]|nr:hypothetical protein F5Y15DRAFT_45620 [Xylariaceae sp. FL0016]
MESSTESRIALLHKRIKNFLLSFACVRLSPGFSHLGTTTPQKENVRHLPVSASRMHNISFLGLIDLFLGESFALRMRHDCNLSSIQKGPLLLGAPDIYINTTVGLILGGVSRGVIVLMATSIDGSVFNLTYDAATRRLHTAVDRWSDQAYLDDVLTFDALPGTDDGMLMQKTGEGCFDGRQTGMFIVVDDGSSDHGDLAGWSMCGLRSGLTWSGTEAPMGTNGTKVWM